MEKCWFCNTGKALKFAKDGEHAECTTCNVSYHFRDDGQNWVCDGSIFPKKAKDGAIIKTAFGTYAFDAKEKKWAKLPNAIIKRLNIK